MPTAPELQQLIDQVTATTSLEASVVTFINGVAARIQAIIDAGGSPQQFTDLAASLKASAQAVSDALAANTPVTPQVMKSKKP